MLSANLEFSPLPTKKLGCTDRSAHPRLIRDHSITITPLATAPIPKANFNTKLAPSAMGELQSMPSSSSGDDRT
jgi:hypothetical protein